MPMSKFQFPNVILFLFALSCSAYASAQTPAAAPGLRVGVIDYVAAVEQYPRYIKLRAAFEQRMNAYEAELKDLAKSLEELRGTIQVLTDEDERADKEFQLQIGLQRQDYLRKKYRDQMALEDLRNTLSVYEDLEFAIGKVAQKKGLHLVLTKKDIRPNAKPIAEQSAREVQTRVQAYDRRQVWFAAEELDITADVIKYMQVPLPKRDAPERAPEKDAAGAQGN